MIYDWLENKGINTAGMVIDNGAGLTRHGRITARQGAQILEHAWNSAYSADLMASMPIIAMDGTMARRLRNTGMDGEGRIKTGYLENVRSIAGFTRDSNNTTWAVVGMVNNDPAWNGQAVLDRILYSLEGSLVLLGILYPPTCVGLRYGHPVSWLEAFLGSVKSGTSVLYFPPDHNSCLMSDGFAYLTHSLFRRTLPIVRFPYPSASPHCS